LKRLQNLITRWNTDRGDFIAMLMQFLDPFANSVSINLNTSHAFMRMWTDLWRIVEFKTAIAVIVQHEKNAQETNGTC